MSSGESLYATVCHYAGLGIHRAGTDVDHATATWMAGELEHRGLDVDPQPVPFDRWIASSTLTADDVAVDHLPVFHEWTGSIDTTAVHVVGFDPAGGGRPGVLEGPIGEARAAGVEAAVLATAHPQGTLVAVNRVPGQGSGFPTVLVAGRELHRLRDGTVRLELEASLQPGETTNIVARNDVAGDPLVLTTPLTGWFGCAGERGTGVAVLLDLVERFIERPLLVVATGGHELHYLGVRRWVEANRIAPGAIVHVGASVAVDAPDRAGGRRLVPTRVAMTSLTRDEATPVAAALEPIGLELVTDARRWMGESEVFCDVGAPMLSLTGSGIDFHTPDDTPERATSPDSLARVARAIGDATDALDRRTSNRNAHG